MELQTRLVARIAPGAVIDYACEDACALRSMCNADIHFEFNGTHLVATENCNPESLVRQFYAARKDSA